jgi:hypothetical protein
MHRHQVGAQPAEDIGRQDTVGMGAAEHRNLGVDACGQTGVVKFVDFMTAQPTRTHLSDDRSCATSSIMDVAAIRTGSLHGMESHALTLHQRLQDGTRLATERAAQPRLATEIYHHTCDPKTLTTGMQMNLGAIVSARLHCHGQQWRRGEHEDRRRIGVTSIRKRTGHPSWLGHDSPRMRTATDGMTHSIHNPQRRTGDEQDYPDGR